MAKTMEKWRTDRDALSHPPWHNGEMADRQTWSQSKPSGAVPESNYSATLCYGAEGCPAVRLIVHDPHQVLGWC